MTFAWKKLTNALGASTTVPKARRTQRMQFSWDNLEERKVLSHASAAHHVQAAVAHVAASGTGSTTGTGSGSTSNSTLTAALKTLHTDVQAIEAASGTTIGDLTAIRTAFQTLKTDSLTPTSQSALSTFENSLVTTFAGGTAVTGNATLLASFEALYTPTGTTLTSTQTTDLTTAYNALAKAVTDSGITEANITTINTDYAAVLAAQGSTSTATYPYFSLVTGGGPGGPGGFGGGPGGFGGGHGHGGGSCSM